MNSEQQARARKLLAWRRRLWRPAVFGVSLIAIVTGAVLFAFSSATAPSAVKAEPWTATATEDQVATTQDAAPIGSEAGSGEARPVPAATSTVASAGAPVKNDECLICHRNKTLSMELPSGERLKLYVDGDLLGRSKHGKVNCVDCHTDISSYPHELRTFTNARAFSLNAYELCQKCHPAVYNKNRDGAHAAALAGVTQNAPVCTDCHGYHDVVEPDNPRTLISQTCAKCHKPIYDQYTESIHGSALASEGNPDVPVCTDCHGVHNIANPMTAVFRVESPEMCARCHSDEKLMGKYDLPANVYRTYNEDFHGVTVKFYETKFPTVWCYKAVCTDCHGVHNIRKTHDPASMVSANNIVTTCQKCHPDANANFPKAWTGHTEPGPDNSPVTYYIQTFYDIVIPATMVGVVAFMGADFVRTLSHRRRKEKHQ